MKRALVALITLLALLIPAASSATTGWARYDSDTWVRFHLAVDRPLAGENVSGQYLDSLSEFLAARHEAIAAARSAHRAWLERLEAARRLAAAQRAAAAARASQAASTPSVPENGSQGPPGGNYGESGGCASGYVHDLIVRAFTPLGSVAHALFVARRESNCNPRAYNPVRLRLGHASGVFQILYPGIWSMWGSRCGIRGSPFSAYLNVTMAACMVRNGGWGPWGG